MAKDKNHRPTEQEPGHLFLWHPQAIISPDKMPTMGLYPKGYPEGAVIHYTAGPYKRGAEDAIECIRHGIMEEYTYLCIGYDGTLIQAHPLNEWGYHAGQSYWPGLGKSLSSKLIGIELCSAGKVEKQADGTFKSWWGETIPEDQVRFVDEKYGSEEGYYHAFSLVQEQCLWSLLVWLYGNDPEGRFKFENILGHHEIAGKNNHGGFRKTDPGGSLSLSMEMLRTGLKFYSEAHLGEGFNGFEI